jgi:hypothetical protein
MLISIIQSCYVPWKGFFDLIGRCDEYVIFDSVQYVKRHWHNRNRIMTANGTGWLTIPVITKGRYDQKINQVEIEKPWADKHWHAIELAYKRSAHFDEFASKVQAWYERAERERLLSDVNAIFLRGIAEHLGLKTRITSDSIYPARGMKTERLVSIARAAGASRYISGPSARFYLDETEFLDAGISVEWMNYNGYAPYNQLHESFDHHVSILDTIFNTGSEIRKYMTSSNVLSPSVSEL